MTRAAFLSHCQWLRQFWHTIKQNMAWIIPFHRYAFAHPSQPALISFPELCLQSRREVAEKTRWEPFTLPTLMKIHRFSRLLYGEMCSSYLNEELQLPVIKEVHLASAALRHLQERRDTGVRVLGVPARHVAAGSPAQAGGFHSLLSTSFSLINPPSFGTRGKRRLEGEKEKPPR